MSRKRGFFSRLLSLASLAVAVFAVIYFFFPDYSERWFSISWDRTRAESELRKAGKAAQEVADELSGALQDAGASAEEAGRVISRISTEQLKDALMQTAAGGADALRRGVDSLVDSLDLGSLDLERRIDLDRVRSQLKSRLSDADFSRALEQLRSGFERGLGQVTDLLKDAVN